MDSSLSFYYPQGIAVVHDKSYPIFHFTEELRQVAPKCKWTILGKPPAMLDEHVAEIYQKETRRFNQQVDRNKQYFRPEWRFQPTAQEWNTLKYLVKKHLQEGDTPSVTLSQVFGGKAISNTPAWFYTAPGVDMAAFFQKTPAAKQHAIFIVEAFQQFKKQLQQHYINVVALIQESGFQCSVDNQIATKKDIAKFLKVPVSTLSSFLRKHADEIKPLRLDAETIRSMGSKARRLNGYYMDDVAKIVFAMDTPVSIDLKKRIFGQIGAFASPHSRGEIQWRKVLAEVFKGFDLHYNYPIGKYRVDFFVAKMGTGLVLECNGISHKYYNRQEEEKREKAITKRYALVRFHPEISLESLFNGILQAKVGAVVRLYDLENICR